MNGSVKASLKQNSQPNQLKSAEQHINELEQRIIKLEENIKTMRYATKTVAHAVMFLLEAYLDDRVTFHNEERGDFAARAPK